MEVIAAKKCTKCLKMCSVSEFGLQDGTADGLRPHCKPCRRAADAVYRATHPVRKRPSARKSRAVVRSKPVEPQTAVPLPAPPDLSLQLLHLHVRRPYGATPGQLRGAL